MAAAATAEASTADPALVPVPVEGEGHGASSPATLWDARTSAAISPGKCGDPPATRALARWGCRG
jgi:hypothetical protein